ncbi:MAG: Tol-Pal system protein TolB [Rhabdochlamydiaceae bacterium]|nr:Tol-Pal system protein TolB [Rhabdochlamydiaceae bacterium]
MKYIYIIAVMLTGFLTAESPQEIRVLLDTQSSLSSIYLSYIHCTDSSLPANYIKELEKILQFDFDHNGKTKVSNKTKEKELLLTSSDQQAALLKGIEAPFALSFSLKQKGLHCRVYSLLEGHTKSFAEIHLTGSLAQDRQKLHKLSDAIHKTLFREDGIAYSRILYSYQRKNGSSEGSWGSEIIECDWDGENSRVITEEKSYCVTPVLIPKGEGMTKEMFLYVSYKTGQPKIFIASLEEGKGKKAVDIRGNQILPAISKKRDKIAFICDATGRTDLFVQPIHPDTGRTGTPKQLFSYPKSTQASPTFSPDGSKIAFVSDKDGAARIYTIPTEAGSSRPTANLITKKSRESSCPSWSPDGKKLAYSAKTEGTRQIWIYDFSTGDEKQLTYGPGNKENPCWANNSLHIVFNSTDGISSDLYIVNLNQPEAVKITKGPGKKHYPTWGLR